MGLVPARAWDTVGVLTMRALHAPFLVASDALVAEIVTGELADEMLDGLEDVGVTGLALAPAGLRHLFVFGKVPKSLDDLAGDVVRAPTSDTTYATLEALGLKPDDLTTSYDAFTDGVEDGTVTAAESSFVLASGLPAPATAIGDVALYPRVDAIVVNSGVFDELTEEQQGALRQAAEATRDWAISTTPSETDAAADYCDRGLDIVTTDFDQRAMQRAVQPVYDELEEDPTTRSMIKVIETLKQDDPVSLTQIECDSVLPDDEDQSTPDDAAVLNGVYRFVVTEERMAARGYSQSEIDVESGINTVTMEDGSFTDEWRSPQGPRTCTASYTVTGQRVTFRWIQGCYGDWAATYTMDGDTVRWSDLEALPPYNSTEDQKATETYFAIPWTRID